MRLKQITYLVLLFNLFFANSQNTIYQETNKFIIGDITFSGNYNLENNAIINLINLEVGQTIDIPGEEIQNALKTLWKQGVFAVVFKLILKEAYV